MSFIAEHGLAIVTILLAVSELLGSVASIKSNNVFGLVVAGLKSLAGALAKKQDTEAK